MLFSGRNKHPVDTQQRFGNRVMNTWPCDRRHCLHKNKYNNRIRLVINHRTCNSLCAPCIGVNPHFQIGTVGHILFDSAGQSDTMPSTVVQYTYRQLRSLGASLPRGRGYHAMRVRLMAPMAKQCGFVVACDKVNATWTSAIV